MKKLIAGTSILIINLSGLAFSQSKDQDSKLSASVQLNQIADFNFRLSVGFEAAYNLSRKVSLVVNYFNSKNSSSNKFSTSDLIRNYFLLSSRIYLTEKTVKLFFETGPVLTYYTTKVEGTAERYVLISSENGSKQYRTEYYKYSNEITSNIGLGVNVGAGAEVPLYSDISALVKGDQVLIANPTRVLNNVFSFSAGIKYNF